MPPETDEAIECFAYLGDGCCGASLGWADACGGCAAGSVSAAACVSYTDTVGDLTFPEQLCRQDFGGGCCGAPVDRNACNGECPAGSVEETTCIDYTSASDRADPPPEEAPSPPDPGMPLPYPYCWEELSPGCCGDTAVEQTACGSCPVGYILEFECLRWGFDRCD